MIRKQNRIIHRYKAYRAPYNKNKKDDKGFKYFKSEKEAKKSPYYE